MLRYEPGGEQVWQQHQVGYEPAYKTITGAIFEFGFTDAILQMWAAYVGELARHQEGDTGVAPTWKAPGRFATCVTPGETGMSHRVFTAALRSQQDGLVVMDATGGRILCCRCDVSVGLA